MRKALKGEVGVGTGGMVQNRIVFMLLLQPGEINVLQPDASRVGDVKHALAESRGLVSSGRNLYQLP